MSSAFPSAAALTADGAPSPSTVSFSVQALPDPGVMPRVLELFAKRGLVPNRWHSTASETTLTIDMQMAGLDRDVAEYIARCMRQIHGVETVLETASLTETLRAA